jgi:hypothetical protein
MPAGELLQLNGGIVEGGVADQLRQMSSQISFERRAIEFFSGSNGRGVMQIGCGLRFHPTILVIESSQRS